MMNLLSRTLVAICLIVPVAAAADDEGMRCGSKLIEIGMTRSAVLGQCGAPSSKSEEIVPVRSGNQVVGQTSIQRWTYADYSSTRVLVFDQDKLVSIE
jgi:hypothetical protein